MRMPTAHHSSTRAFLALGATVATVASCAARRDAPVALTSSCTAAVPLRWFLNDLARPRALRVFLYVAPETGDRWERFGSARLRTAMAHWNGLDLPVRFQAVDQPGGADVIVEIIPRFEIDDNEPAAHRYRAGVTHLTYHNTGEITRAYLQIAETTPFAVRYPVTDQIATLIHELGHALGLPHARSPFALMASRPQSTTVTGADLDLIRAHYGSVPCSRTRVASSNVP
jgi:hypothetical protein